MTRLTSATQSATPSDVPTLQQQLDALWLAMRSSSHWVDGGKYNDGVVICLRPIYGDGEDDARVLDADIEFTAPTLGEAIAKLIVHQIAERLDT